METKNKTLIQKMNQGIKKLGIAGAVTLGVASFGANLYLAGKQIYDSSTADVKGRQSYEQAKERGLATINGTTIYGYDFDKDGRLDGIRESWSWIGSRAAAPCERTYRSGDKEFANLKAVLESGRN